jgi:hypothetical protein
MDIYALSHKYVFTYFSMSDTLTRRKYSSGHVLLLGQEIIIIHPVNK